MDKQKEKIYLIFSLCVCFFCVLLLAYYSRLPAELTMNAMGQDVAVSDNEIDAEIELREPAEIETQQNDDVIDTSDIDELNIEEGAVIKKEQQPSSLYENIVIIDAGHGGNDVGAQRILEPAYMKHEEQSEQSDEKSAQGRKTLTEKDLTLEIAKRVGAELMGKQFDVSYTRQEDVQVSIKDRCQLIKEAKPYLTVSIHVEYDMTHAQHGMAICFNEEAKKLLETSGETVDSVSQLVKKYTSEDVKVCENASGEGVLIYDVATPAIQVNLGYLSNVQDAKMLAREDYRKRLVKGLTEAILLLIEDIM